MTRSSSGNRGGPRLPDDRQRKRSHQWYVTQSLKLLRMGVAGDLGITEGAVSDLEAALVCAAPVVVEAPPTWQHWLLAARDPFTTEVVNCLQAASAAVQSFAAYVATTACCGEDSHLWHLYEFFLGDARKMRGVYYTPPAVARYVVAQADRRLREHFGFQLGFADALPFHILEPACGSGVFVSALIEQVRREPSFDQAAAARLISNLIAIDISPVAAFLTRLRLALALHSAGINLSADFPQPCIACGNTLAGPETIPALRESIGVVLGNPPFSYLSQNDQPWIQSLVRGDAESEGYFAIDGESLGEKKTWLHDDYVKFLRLAQWCIEQHGSGVVSLVTNHGWLDNATFRIARQQLLRTFQRIDVVDLHGNAKRHEASPTPERDENVFGIAQGIALVTLTKSPGGTSSQVSRADLWGSRETKLQALSQAAVDEPLPTQAIVPAAPWFTFAAQSAEVPLEYRAAPLLSEVMPVNSTVPVTARDYFVVAATREELQERLNEFCDPKIGDDEIRRKYFQRTRSNRYEPGDTRGWKLSSARRTLMSESDPARCIRRCLYRPFVWRYVSWHPTLIDWPRSEFTRHFDGVNLALLARRQSIAGRAANFFWITDCLPLDGVIRSDNRGSESFFPLWVSREQGITANFAADWLQEYEPRTSLAYVYALFHSPTYRTRYVAGQAMEFPRVLRPTRSTLFQSLARLGEQLITLHLTDPRDGSSLNPHTAPFTPHSDIENFHVGTYNVCRKWLQMQQESRDSAAFAGLQQLIAYTLGLQRQIDEQIELAGGFPEAFQASGAVQSSCTPYSCHSGGSGATT